MSGRRLPEGKLAPGLLTELLGEAAAPSPELRLGPQVGEDACAIDVPAGALVVAADPITLTGEDVGAHAVVINANDVAVTGVAPRWFTATVLLPPGTEESLLRRLFGSMRQALDALGAVLVGGHTEVTAAVVQPLVAGQMFGLAPDGRVLPTGGARPGDAVFQAGPVPVEGAAVLAEKSAPALDALPGPILAAARRALVEPGISVVAPALAAAELGAAALHDPTEGGLASGLEELAVASGVRLRLNEDRIDWFEPGRAVCAATGADPWGTLASGCLLGAFRPERAAAAVEELSARGFAARVIGRAEAGRGVYLSDGTPAPRFERDEVSRVLESPPERPRRSR
ncbi:MAG: hydrogenase expression protein [Proteobacteria bacterium]|nr:hydrogenase expression protein [Pseudomonadota bacterium]